jgi:hypothetical protein
MCKDILEREITKMIFSTAENRRKRVNAEFSKISAKSLVTHFSAVKFLSQAIHFTRLRGDNSLQF